MTTAEDQPRKSEGLLPSQETGWCEAPGRPLMRAISDTHGGMIYFRPRCKKWDCPYCRVENARYWAVCAHHGTGQLMGRNQGVHFVTLTAHESLRTQSQTIYVWRKAWPKLMQRARRESGGSQPYLAIPEPHLDGRVHIHMLTTHAMKDSWWKDNAREVGLGYMAKTKAVDDAPLAGWYVTKYMGKQLALNAWPPNFHRVRVSQSWERPPNRELINWRFETIRGSEVEQQEQYLLSHRGQNQQYVIITTNHRTAWAMIEFLDANG